MIHRQHGDAAAVKLRGDVHGDAVHHTVFSAVENHALHIGQRLQLLCRNIMGIDFAVYAQLANGPGQSGVLRAAQIQNDNHILLHILPFPFYTRIFPTSRKKASPLSW